MEPPVYDIIGHGYAATRRGDPRIAAQIQAALGPAHQVVNVGAGAGSYEPTDAHVVAVEPSRAMLRQRARDAAPAVRAVAERLPFRDHAFDAAMATLTIHHWTDWRAGLRELTRVAPRVVLLTWDPGCIAWSRPARDPFWLTTDYFPEIDAFDLTRFPVVDDVAAALAPARVEVVPVARDCTDGFLNAFWARPEAYLDADTRQASSGFSLLPPDVVARGVARLETDLRSGAWDARHGWLRALDRVDLGYRLIVKASAGSPASPPSPP